MKLIVLLAIAGVLPCAAQRPFSRNVTEHSQSLAPYVASPQQIVDRMLELANLKAGETVYDLGCGDGRILITAAQRYHAHAVGVELSQRLAREAEEQVKRLNLQNLITIIHGNLLNVSLDPADVVTIYLETGSNEQLRPNLEKYLKSGARVVSHDFAVRGWKPKEVVKMEAFNRPHVIYLYTMPVSKK